MCDGGISQVNTGLSRPFPNRIDRHETQDACVRRISVHKGGHEKTWKQEGVWQRYRRSYSHLGIDNVFVYAAGELVLVVFLRCTLSAFFPFAPPLPFLSPSRSFVALGCFIATSLI
jgi:hypothetical protein